MLDVACVNLGRAGRLGVSMVGLRLDVARLCSGGAGRLGVCVVV